MGNEAATLRYRDFVTFFLYGCQHLSQADFTIYFDPSEEEEVHKDYFGYPFRRLPLFEALILTQLKKFLPLFFQDGIMEMQLTIYAGSSIPAIRSCYQMYQNGGETTYGIWIFSSKYQS
ncbi:MAG: hypothetical protein JXR73_18750 [Candidatus Omnitrophica bacterium]|nr:hypothetical protein [Candidatus Omnitrophota bacterium]